MPADEYTAVGGGALKIKGAKVGKKKKKKHHKDKSDLEKNLSTGDDEPAGSSALVKSTDDKPRDDGEQPPPADDVTPLTYKTEAERRHYEAKRKRVRCAYASATGRE